jgi:hypothetical protein
MPSISVIDSAMGFEGMTTRPGLGLLAAFLKRSQMLNGEKRGLIEFGTYKGRVSALMGLMQRTDDRLDLVDVKDYLDRPRLDSLGINYHFHLSTSEKWDSSQLEADEVYFSHHDASHYFHNVSHELNEMRGLLSPYGVIALDDFTDTFNQVRAAYYHQRYALGGPFELLLQGWGKAILVRTAAFGSYEKFVLEDLQPILRGLGMETMLARTDAVPESRAFSIVLKKGPDEPDRYGLRVWGDRFYRPSVQTKV